MKPGFRDVLWMAIGAVVGFAVILLVLHFQDRQNPAAHVAFKATRIEMTERMRLGLASASEAEKSAVMAITDEDSQTYADQARAITATVEQGRKQLEQLLGQGGASREKDLLDQFSQAFAELQRIDNDLLVLAVKNTNLKASDLTFGPATVTLKEMDAALVRIVAARGSSATADDLKVLQFADGARIGALRLLTLLPPHIAEESAKKMDEMEAAMAAEHAAVRQNLEGLAALANLSGNPDLTTATARYAQFGELEAQILTLSRENTNVRSLAISLNQKRKAMMICQDALAALEQTIQAEPSAAPASPR